MAKGSLKIDKQSIEDAVTWRQLLNMIVRWGELQGFKYPANLIQWNLRAKEDSQEMDRIKNDLKSLRLEVAKMMVEKQNVDKKRRERSKAVTRIRCKIRERYGDAAIDSLSGMWKNAEAY